MRKDRRILPVMLLTVLLVFLLPALACSTSSDPADPTVTPTPEVKTTPYDPTMEAEVDLEDTPVRNGPGLQFEKIGTLKKGTKLVVTGVSSNLDWYRLRTPAGIDPKGKEVWISSIFVKVIQPTLPPMPQAP